MITDDQLLSSPTIREALGRMRGVGLDKIAGVPTLEAAVLDLTTKFAYALLKQARVQSGLQSAAKLAGLQNEGYYTGLQMGVLPGVLGAAAGSLAAPEGADHGHAFLQGAGGGTIGGLVGGTAGYMLGRPFGMGAATGMGLAGALGLGAYAGHNAGKAYPLSTEDVDAQLAAIEGGKSAPLLRSEAPRAVDEDAEVAKIANVLQRVFRRPTGGPVPGHAPAPRAADAVVAMPGGAAKITGGSAAATPNKVILPEYIRNHQPAELPKMQSAVERMAPPSTAPKTKAKPTQTFDPHELQANAFLAARRPISSEAGAPFTLAGMKGRTVTAALQIPGSIMRGGLAGAGIGAVGGAIGAGEGNRMQGALGGAAVGAGVGAGAGQLARRNFGNAMKGIDAAQGAGTANRMQAAQAFARGQTAQAARGGASWDDATKFMARPEIAAVNQARGQRNLTLAGGTAAAGLGAAGIAAAASPSERR